MDLKKIVQFSMQDQGKKLYAILLVCIVCLFAFSLFGGKEKTENNLPEESHENTSSYIQYYEDKLEEILSQIEGAGKVSVMITLESGSQKIYAQEVDNNRTSGTEREEDSIHQKPLVISKNGSQEAVIEKELQPEIQGVLIACTGGNSEKVRLDIVQSVKTLFHISSNKVHVVQSKN